MIDSRNRYKTTFATTRLPQSRDGQAIRVKENIPRVVSKKNPHFLQSFTTKIEVFLQLSDSVSERNLKKEVFKKTFSLIVYL